MSELCSTNFTKCTNCERINAFGEDHPDYIACINPKKNTSECTELSAFMVATDMAASTGKCISHYSVDCDICGFYCNCNNPPFYCCKPQGWDRDDFYHEESCCETCDTKLFNLRKAQEHQVNVDDLKCSSEILPSLKEKLMTLEEELPEKMRLNVEKRAVLISTMQKLAIEVFSLSLNTKNISNIYSMEKPTEQLATITKELGMCITQFHNPESLVDEARKRVASTEREIVDLTRRIESYTAIHNSTSPK